VALNPAGRISQIPVRVSKLCTHDLLTYLCLIPFFIWSFLGGWRQQIFFVVSDYIASFLALVAGWAILAKRWKFHRLQAEIASIYIVFLFLSNISFLLADWDWNFYSIVPGFLYFFIAISLSIFFEDKSNLFFKTGISSALFSTFVILLSCAVLGVSDWGRVTIPFYSDGEWRYFSNFYSDFTDPNLVAYYLVFGAFLLFLFEINGLWLVAFLGMVFAIFLTMSRSAVVGMFFSIVFAGSMQITRKNFIRYLRIFLVVFFVLIALLIVVDSTYIGGWIYDRVHDENSNDDRMKRLSIAGDLLIESASYLIFGRGHGYSSFTIDPHNFYLSTVIDTGIFSLGCLLAILFLLYARIVRQRVRKFIICATMILVFFLTISIFYWQVRVYYFVVLQLFVLESASRHNSVRNFSW